MSIQAFAAKSRSFTGPSLAFTQQSLKPKYLHASRRQIAVQSNLNAISLQCGATTLKIPIPDGQIEPIAVTINGLIKTFAEKQKGGKPQRYETVECRVKGDPSKGEVPLFELFCNPNAHTNAFDAKVLVTVKSGDGISIMTETTLEQVKAGVKDALLAAREKSGAK